MGLFERTEPARRLADCLHCSSALGPGNIRIYHFDCTRLEIHSGLVKLFQVRYNIMLLTFFFMRGKKVQGRSGRGGKRPLGNCSYHFRYTIKARWKCFSAFFSCFLFFSHV